MFQIDEIAETPLVQTPRVVKHQAYCKNFHNLGTTDTVDQCYNLVADDAENCGNSENTFTWDPANSGWCSCCKAGVKDALKQVVKTRDVESKIYKQDNDRTNDGAIAWNGPGFSGDKQIFAEGWYDIQRLTLIGNDRMTGLEVPAHLKVTLYQHHKAQGKKETFYGPYEHVSVPDWKRTVTGIRVEKNEKYVEPKMRSAYVEYTNYCVDKDNNDIHQTRWVDGAKSLDQCKMECDSKDQCGGVEWYESGWNGSKCHLLLTGWGVNKASAGSTGGLW